MRAREAIDFTPDDVMNLFAAGQSVMAISWPSGGRLDRVQPPSLAQPTDVQFASLPGSTEMYDFREDRWMPRASDEPLCVPLLGVAGRLGAVSRAQGTPAARPTFSPGWRDRGKAA